MPKDNHGLAFGLGVRLMFRKFEEHQRLCQFEHIWVTGCARQNWKAIFVESAFQVTGQVYVGLGHGIQVPGLIP